MDSVRINILSQKTMDTGKLYPDSRVELGPFIAKHYDFLMNIATAGRYGGFIRGAIHAMGIKRGDRILDLGCGSGRNARIMAGYLNGEGEIVGMDKSPFMEKQFRKKCAEYKNVEFVRGRIDTPFALSRPFDKVFMSFVLHGLPPAARETVLENIGSNLEPRGAFFMLDYSEFSVDDMHPLWRFIFKTIECKYAFDFIARDWKRLLAKYGFSGFKEVYFWGNYVRLLQADKAGAVQAS